MLLQLENILYDRWRKISLFRQPDAANCKELRSFVVLFPLPFSLFTCSLPHRSWKKIVNYKGLTTVNKQGVPRFPKCVLHDCRSLFRGRVLFEVLLFTFFAPSCQAVLAGLVFMEITMGLRFFRFTAQLQLGFRNCTIAGLISVFSFRLFSQLFGMVCRYH